MKKIILGVVIGFVLTCYGVWIIMPKLMLSIHESKYNVDQTVIEIEKSAKANDWQVPKIYTLQASLQKFGHPDMTEAKILSICQADYAYDILKNDDDKRIMAIMPCRIGVYADKTGKVFIASMNMGLMSKMFGGNIAKVMAGVAEEEHNILKNVIKK